jgi:hypothetical protein
MKRRKSESVDSLNTHSAKRPEMDLFRSFFIPRGALERMYLNRFLCWANQGERVPMRNVVLALAAVGMFATVVPATAQYYQQGQRFDGGPTRRDRDDDGPRYRDRDHRHHHHDWPRYRYGFGYGRGYGYGYGSGYGNGRYREGCFYTMRHERWDGTIVIRRINRC